MSSHYFNRADDKPIDYKLVITEEDHKFWFSKRKSEDTHWVQLEGEPSCRLVKCGEIIPVSLH